MGTDLPLCVSGRLHTASRALRSESQARTASSTVVSSPTTSCSTCRIWVVTGMPFIWCRLSARSSVVFPVPLRPTKPYLRYQSASLTPVTSGAVAGRSSGAMQCQLSPVRSALSSTELCALKMHSWPEYVMNGVILMAQIAYLEALELRSVTEDTEGDVLIEHVGYSTEALKPFCL